MTTATQRYHDEQCDKDGIERLGDDIAIGDGYIDVEGYIIVAYVDGELARKWGVEPDSYLMFGETETDEVSDEDFERVSMDVLDEFEEEHADDVDLTEVEPGTVRKIGEFKMKFARRRDKQGHYLVKYGYKPLDEAELVEVDQ